MPRDTRRKLPLPFLRAHPALLCSPVADQVWSGIYQGRAHRRLPGVDVVERNICAGCRTIALAMRRQIPSISQRRQFYQLCSKCLSQPCSIWTEVLRIRALLLLQSSIHPPEPFVSLVSAFINIQGICCQERLF